MQIERARTIGKKFKTTMRRSRLISHRAEKLMEQHQQILKETSNLKLAVEKTQTKSLSR